MDRKMLLAIGMGKPENEGSEYPEFDLPDGVDLTDLEDGEEKEVVAVVRKKGDGRACVVSINGISLGEPEEMDEEEVPEYGDEEPDATSSAGEGQSSTLSAQSGLGERARTRGLM